MVDECQDVKFRRDTNDALVQINYNLFDPAIEIPNVLVGPSSSRIIFNEWVGSSRSWCSTQLITFTGTPGYASVLEYDIPTDKISVYSNDMAQLNQNYYLDMYIQYSGGPPGHYTAKKT